MDSEEEDKEIERQDPSGENDNTMGEHQAKYFGWLELVDQVGQLTRDKWDDVFRKNIYEFFNLVSYIRHKNNKEKQQLEQWKRTH